MDSKKSFTDRFIERVDAIDGSSLQAYLLRLSKDKGFFATILNAIDEGILVVDRTLLIRYHNAKAKELLGLPANLSRVRLSHFIRNLDWHGILQENSDGWTRLVREEVEISYPDRRILKLYLAPQELNGESCALVILSDVTAERRRSQAEMEESTAKAVSLLAAGVAHEIGNPLNSLYLNLQIIEAELAEMANPQLADTAEMVNTCIAEVERLDNIIHQFLHAIRPGQPQLEPLGIDVVVGETISFMQQEFELRGVKVILDFAEAIPAVLGDAAQLKQAFYNILKNSVQSMSSGGTIKISCSYDANYLNLTFADTGCGVTAEQLNSMFDPFKTFKVGGSGLGMMIIQRILNEHGALFSISSDPGEGFTFAIRFPRQDLAYRPHPQLISKGDR